jgi:hypothetical protein
MADVTEAQLSARLKLFKNGTVVVDQPYKMNSTTYTEYAADRVILATNMSVPQEYNMGGVATGKFLFVSVDRPVLICLDVTTDKWPLGRGTKGGVVAMISTGFTHVYFQNESTTNTVTADVVVANES